MIHQMIKMNKLKMFWVEFVESVKFVISMYRKKYFKNIKQNVIKLNLVKLEFLRLNIIKLIIKNKNSKNNKNK